MDENASVEEYLFAVGKVVTNATSIDAFMASTLQILISCTPQVANAIFYNLDGLQPRESLLTRVVKAVGDSEDLELIEKINRAAEKANKQRKQVAHVMAAFDSVETHSNFRVFHPKSRQFSYPTKDYLVGLVSQTHAAFVEVQQAFRKLCEKRGVPPILTI